MSSPVGPLPSATNDTMTSSTIHQMSTITNKTVRIASSVTINGLESCSIATSCSRLMEPPWSPIFPHHVRGFFFQSNTGLLHSPTYIQRSSWTAMDPNCPGCDVMVLSTRALVSTSALSRGPDQAEGKHLTVDISTRNSNISPITVIVNCSHTDWLSWYFVTAQLWHSCFSPSQVRYTISTYYSSRLIPLGHLGSHKGSEGGGSL
ncbi:hypothetical protein B0T20DRAFT_11073 [Sordaria brevicollis]|uniref:Uncharacterized protein n=1 Tax=Sordaria brevicollis TaxID=83679 RepID=A0AAE0PNE1_SORBR|nr:hypothetical protein B0T20DRAFT_11073 [Sordaria brevicollis]